jgi:hypothetical protein
MTIQILMSCISEKPRCFGGIYFLHLQGRRLNQVRNEQGTRTRGKRSNAEGLVLEAEFFLRMTVTQQPHKLLRTVLEASVPCS